MYGTNCSATLDDHTPRGAAGRSTAVSQGPRPYQRRRSRSADSPSETPTRGRSVQDRGRARSSSTTIHPSSRLIRRRWVNRSPVAVTQSRTRVSVSSPWRRDRTVELISLSPRRRQRGLTPAIPANGPTSTPSLSIGARQSDTSAERASSIASTSASVESRRRIGGSTPAASLRTV